MGIFQKIKERFTPRDNSSALKAWLDAQRACTEYDQKYMDDVNQYFDDNKLNFLERENIIEYLSSYYLQRPNSYNQLKECLEAYSDDINRIWKQHGGDQIGDIFQYPEETDRLKNATVHTADAYERFVKETVEKIPYIVIGTLKEEDKDRFMRHMLGDLQKNVKFHNPISEHVIYKCTDKDNKSIFESSNLYKAMKYFTEHFNSSMMDFDICIGNHLLSPIMHIYTEENYDDSITDYNIKFELYDELWLHNDQHFLTESQQSDLRELASEFGDLSNALAGEQYLKKQMEGYSIDDADYQALNYELVYSAQADYDKAMQNIKDFWSKREVLGYLENGEGVELPIESGKLSEHVADAIAEHLGGDAVSDRKIADDRSLNKDMKKTTEKKNNQPRENSR